MSAPKDLNRPGLDQLEERAIKMVRLLVPDLHGVARAKQITIAHFLKVIEGGHTWATPLLGVDLAQELATDSPLEFDNCAMVPDLATLQVLPWRPSVAQVICDLRRHPDEILTSRDLLRDAVARADASGFTPHVGNELEFYVYRAEGDAFTPPINPRDWYSAQALGIVGPFLERLHEALAELALPVYEIFNEHGPGQFEMNLEPGPALERADAVFLAKSVIKELAREFGLRATFMTKPSGGDAYVVPSGYHLHQTLLDDAGNNAFVGDGPDALSKIGQSYIAGQLKHARALTLFAAQTLTSYKRFVPGTWAPLDATWSIGDRGRMVRAILAGSNTRIENRLGSADSNPYLLAASQITAGMLGVEGSDVPPAPEPRTNGEVDLGRAIPVNLVEAILSLEADAEHTDALDRPFVTMYLDMLRTVHDRFRRSVTDWEISEYREVL